MANGKIYYLLNKVGQKQNVLQGGNSKQIQEIEGTINNEDLNIFNIDYNGNISFSLGFKNLYELLTKKEILNLNSNSDQKYYGVTVDFEIMNSLYEKPSIEAIKGIITFDKSMEFQELIEYRKDMIKRLEEKKIELENQIKAKEKEKDNWIENYGSKRLKLLKKNNFEYDKYYVTERVSAPDSGISGYFVDTQKRAITTNFSKTIYTPDLIELVIIDNLRKCGYDANIVLMTNLPDNFLYLQDDIVKADHMELQCFSFTRVSGFKFDKALVIELTNIYNSGYSAYMTIDDARKLSSEKDKRLKELINYDTDEYGNEQIFY